MEKYPASGRASMRYGDLYYEFKDRDCISER